MKGYECIVIEKRLNLASKKRHNKQIDMQRVYKELDNGRTVKSVAEELGVSESTLRRRHKEYQENLSQKMKKQKEEEEKEEDCDFLPDFFDL